MVKVRSKSLNDFLNPDPDTEIPDFDPWIPDSDKWISDSSQIYMDSGFDLMFGFSIQSQI